MVEVFREVWRVLRDDGTLWLNLGASYASSGINPSQSPLLSRDLSCDSDDKAPLCSQDGDRACPGSCDESQGETQNHHDCTVHSDQPLSQSEPLPLQKDHDSEHSDCVEELQHSLPSDVQASSTRASFRRDRAACVPSTKASVSPQDPQTSSGSVQASEHTKACKNGTSPKLQPLVIRTKGKESFYSACQSPGCKGIGKCGLCWCSLAIPSLNIKPKDEINMPHLVALALQADGWYLRQDIIWHKPNPMPESVTDRCTKAHEYIFLLTKKARYYYDADAIKEPCVESNASRPRMGQGSNTQYEQKRGEAKHRQTDPQASGHRMIDNVQKARDAGNAHDNPFGETRNKRSVWTVPTKSYSEAHFATFPPDLIEPCILAGCPKEVCVECGEPRVRIVKSEQIKRERKTDTTRPCDDRSPSANSVAGVSTETTGWTDCGCNAGFRPGIALDPFMGSGTVAEVAIKNGRDYLGCELNPEYMPLNNQRTQSAETGLTVKELKAGQQPLF